MARESERIQYFDMARGLCILLVVLGHQIGWDNPLRNVIYSFHMALFFVLSGAIDSMSATNTMSLFPYAKKKTKSLLIPYFLWGGVFVLADIIRILWFEKHWNSIIFDIAALFTGYGINVLWFLITLMIAHIIMFLIRNSSQKNAVKFMIVLIMGIGANVLWSIANELFFADNASAIIRIVKWMAIGLLRPLVVLPFLWVGLYLPQYMKKYRGWHIVGLAALFFIINVYFSVTMKMKVAVVSLDFSNWCYMYIAGISGTMFIVSGCRWLYEHYCAPAISVLSWFGKHSLLIMLVHEYLSIQELSRYICSGIHNVMVNEIVVYCVWITVISIIVLLIRKPHGVVVNKIAYMLKLG